MRLRKPAIQQVALLQPPSERKEGPKKRSKIGLWLILSFALLVPVLLYWYWSFRWVITHGRVVAEAVQVSAAISGRISHLPVRENDRVTRGQLVAQLADEELKAELKAAEARMKGAQSRLAHLKRAALDPAVLAQVDAALRDVNVAKEKYQRAQAVAARAEQMFLLQALTRDQWEKAQADLREEEAAVQGAQKLYERAQEALSYAEQKLVDDLAFLRLEVSRTEAEVELGKRRLAQTAIYAPRNATISWLPRKVGEVVAPNDVIMNLNDEDRLWIEAYVTGSDLSHLEEGREAWVTIEGLPNKEHRGRVSLFYTTEKPAERVVQVGPFQARVPSQLPDLTHPVKVIFAEGMPAGLQPEMIARVRIARR
jgi:multidrug resistance efflux pump